MKKILVKTLVIFCIAISLMNFIGCKPTEMVYKNAESGSKPTDFNEIVISQTTISTGNNESDYVKKNQDGIITEINLPTEENAEGHKILAVALYKNACLLDQLAEHRKSNSYCITTTTTMGLTVYVDTMVYAIKTQQEYCFVQYQLPRTKTTAEKNIMRLFGAKSNGTRSYYRLGMDVVETQVSDDASYDSDGNPYSDWNGLINSQSTRIPYISTTQEKNNSVTDMVINLNTIKSAIIKCEEGIIKMTIDLDVDNSETVEYVIDNLQAGAGKDAKYTKIVETIELWDNGYLKYFLSADSWATKTINAYSSYETTYSYWAEDCNIDDYSEIVDFKKILGYVN